MYAIAIVQYAVLVLPSQCEGLIMLPPAMMQSLTLLLDQFSITYTLAKSDA